MSETKHADRFGSWGFHGGAHDVTPGEICKTLRGVWGEYVAQGF